MNFQDIDCEGFARHVAVLRKEIYAEMGEADHRHLKKMEWAGRFCTLFGYATAWIIPNPISAFAISLGNLQRWILMHHISHRGYDKVPNMPARYTSKKFAQGWRRFIDWFDWILPEAWMLEHNQLHHYNTGEVQDPDLVEHNMRYLRDSNFGWPARYAIVLFFALTWKVSYYAPNTYMELLNAQRRRTNQPPLPHIHPLFNIFSAEGFRFWRRCLLPYATVRFAILPALFLPLGVKAAVFVLINSLIAELMTNLHSFCVIGPNHAGDDLYRFDSPIKSRDEFFARQVVGSVNFNCGTDTVDFLHGWLNYQIEHHVFPDMTMLQYQRLQPKFRTLCGQFGLPYFQENVFRRVKKLLDIMVGRTSMLRVDSIKSARAAQAELAETPIEGFSDGLATS